MLFVNAFWSMCSQNFLLLCVLVLKDIIFNVFRIRSRIQKRTKVHHLHLGVQQGQKSQPPYETTFLVREPRLQKYVKKVRIIANQSTFWTNLSDFFDFSRYRNLMLFGFTFHKIQLGFKRYYSCWHLKIKMSKFMRLRW